MITFQNTFVKCNGYVSSHTLLTLLYAVKLPFHIPLQVEWDWIWTLNWGENIMGLKPYILSSLWRKTLNKKNINQGFQFKSLRVYNNFFQTASIVSHNVKPFKNKVKQKLTWKSGAEWAGLTKWQRPYVGPPNSMYV